MKKLSLICLLMAWPIASFAASTAELTKKALSEGYASGFLSGESADKISSQTKSTEPIYMEIKTIKKYKQNGCFRFEFALNQAKAALKNGGTAPLILNWQLNLCNDGNPPVSLQ